MANDYLELKKKILKNLFYFINKLREKEITNIVRSELKNRGDLNNSIFIDAYIALES